MKILIIVILTIACNAAIAKGAHAHKPHAPETVAQKEARKLHAMEKKAKG